MPARSTLTEQQREQLVDRFEQGLGYIAASSELRVKQAPSRQSPAAPAYSQPSTNPQSDASTNQLPSPDTTRPHSAQIRNITHQLRARARGTEVPLAELIDHVILDMSGPRLLVTHRRDLESAHSLCLDLQIFHDRQNRGFRHTMFLVVPDQIHQLAGPCHTVGSIKLLLNHDGAAGSQLLGFTGLNRRVEPPVKRGPCYF